MIVCLDGRKIIANVRPSSPTIWYFSGASGYVQTVRIQLFRPKKQTTHTMRTVPAILGRSLNFAFIVFICTEQCY